MLAACATGCRRRGRWGLECSHILHPAYALLIATKPEWLHVVGRSIDSDRYESNGMTASVLHAAAGQLHLPHMPHLAVCHPRRRPGGSCHRQHRRRRWQQERQQRRWQAWQPCTSGCSCAAIDAAPSHCRTSALHVDRSLSGSRCSSRAAVGAYSVECCLHCSKIAGGSCHVACSQRWRCSGSKAAKCGCFQCP